MRILYITDALAVWGGIERVLRDKMNYLVEHYGYDVHIVTTDQGDHPIPYPLDNRVKVHDLDIRYHHQYRFRGISRFIAYVRLNILFQNRLKNAISSIKPDVIVCIRIEMINTILKAKGNTPLICESHSLCYAYKYENTSFWNRLRLKNALSNVKKADCVVALTEGDANDWRNYNKIVVIPNIVNLNKSGKYSDLKSKSVIYVGRFSEQKDVWSLLKIWEIVHKRFSDWKLHVYGEGELKENFVRIAEKVNIGIEVFPPTSEIFEKYINSSILIMTSLYEPFGLVLPEAMSCGLPVIAFNCPYGPADIITNDEDGFLIENRDVMAFANKIIYLIDNYPKRVEMGRKGIQSSQRFHSDNIMYKWHSLFESYHT